MHVYVPSLFKHKPDRCCPILTVDIRRMPSSLPLCSLPLILSALFLSSSLLSSSLLSSSLPLCSPPLCSLPLFLSALLLSSSLLSSSLISSSLLSNSFSHFTINVTNKWRHPASGTVVVWVNFQCNSSSIIWLNYFLNVFYSWSEAGIKWLMDLFF